MPLLDGLAHYWKLEEDSGNDRVDSHASADLSESLVFGRRAGVVGFAPNFAGATSLGTAGTGALNPGDQDLTVACFVHFDAPLPGQTQMFWSKWNETNSKRTMALVYSSAALRFRFSVSDDGLSQTTAVDADSLGAPSAGTTYYVVCRHNATTNQISIQVDQGTEDTTSHSTGLHSNDQDFEVGIYRQSSGNRFIDGFVDELGYWTRVVPESELEDEHYNGGSGLTYENFSADLGDVESRRHIPAGSSRLLIPQQSAGGLLHNQHPRVFTSALTLASSATTKVTVIGRLVPDNRL